MCSTWGMHFSTFLLRIICKRTMWSYQGWTTTSAYNGEIFFLYHNFISVQTNPFTGYFGHVILLEWDGVIAKYLSVFASSLLLSMLKLFIWSQYFFQWTKCFFFFFFFFFWGGGGGGWGGGAGMAQWWEHSPHTNVAWVRFPDSASYVSWVCWFSTLRGFLQVLRFVNFNLQCPRLVLQR